MATISVWEAAELRAVAEPSNTTKSTRSKATNLWLNSSVNRLFVPFVATFYGTYHNCSFNHLSNGSYNHQRPIGWWIVSNFFWTLTGRASFPSFFSVSFTTVCHALVRPGDESLVYWTRTDDERLFLPHFSLVHLFIFYDLARFSHALFIAY